VSGGRGGDRGREGGGKRGVWGKAGVEERGGLWWKLKEFRAGGMEGRWGGFLIDGGVEEGGRKRGG